jgi:hypothetical protein
VTWIAAAAAALLIGHGFVLAVDLYSAASLSVEAHTYLAGEFDPLLGVVRPTLGGLMLALALFGPIVGARGLAIEKDRHTFHTTVLRSRSVALLVGRKWFSAVLAMGLPWIATVLLMILWRAVGGHVQVGETLVVLTAPLLYTGLIAGLATAAAAFARNLSQAIATALILVALTWGIDAAEGFSALAWMGGAGAWSPTGYLAPFEHGTLTLGGVGWFAGTTAGALALAVVGCRFDLHGVRRLGAALGATAFLVIAALVLKRLPQAWDLTEAHRHSLPPAVVHKLQTLPGAVTITVNLDREDGRRQQIERDVLAKLRLALPNLHLRFPPDEAGNSTVSPSEGHYGQLTIAVGDRRAVTTSNSRREIVTALLSLTDSTAVDWTQADYPGYPLVVTGGKRTLILAVSYVGIPLLLLLTGLAITTTTPRRRQT